jgi:hypothetical protein
MEERTYQEWINILADRRPDALIDVDGIHHNISDHRNELDGDGPRCICEYDKRSDSWEITSMDNMGYRVRVEAVLF